MDIGETRDRIVKFVQSLNAEQLCDTVNLIFAVYSAYVFDRESGTETEVDQSWMNGLRMQIDLKQKEDDNENH